MDKVSDCVRHPYPDMIEAVKTLKSSGLKTALLTNNWYMNEDEKLQARTSLPLATDMFDVVSACMSYFVAAPTKL